MSAASGIEKFWYSNSIFTYLLWPLSALLFLVTRLKYWLYKKEIFNSYQSQKPIVVVGNITVGGTGKTPTIALLARELQNKGLKVGIVSRGHGSSAQSYPHLVTSKDTAKVVGDEVYMLYQMLNIPIAIDSERSAAVKLIESQVDIILSDDGLQHYKMSRSFEILLVDGKRQFGNGLCLPFGPLREDVSRLKTIDKIILNGENAVLECEQAEREKIINMSVSVTGLMHLKSNEQVSLNNLKNKSVDAVCGIGNPSRFFETLNPLCKEITPIVFADHHRYLESDFTQLESEVVVMTEKDAVKCQEFAKDNWYYLPIESKIEDEALSDLIQSILLLNEHKLEESESGQETV